jgi:hypothetical protein
MCNHPFVLIKLVGEGFFKLLQAMLLRSLIERSKQLGVLLFDLLQLGVALQLASWRAISSLFDKLDLFF